MKGKILIIACFILGIFSAAALAVNVEVIPKTSLPGRAVNINVSVQLNPTPPPNNYYYYHYSTATSPQCNVFIDYGDGTRDFAGSCTNESCFYTRTHVYPEPGTYIVRTWVDDSCENINGSSSDEEKIIVKCNPLNLTSANLPSGNVQEPYSYRFSVSGGQPPMSFFISEGKLPEGLTLTADGLIAGMPKASGTYNFKLVAKDSCPLGQQEVSKELSITIKGTTCNELSLPGSQYLPSGKVGKAYNAKISYSGGKEPVSISMTGGMLPSGLSISPNGTISGVPTQAGEFIFEIEVRDSCPSSTQKVKKSYKIRIEPETIYGNLFVTVSPTKATIPRNYASVINLLYTFSGSPEITTRLRSEVGQFLAAGKVVGRDNTSLWVDVTKGQGSVRLNLTVPVTIIKRAERHGTTLLTYVRRFHGKAFDLIATMEIVITTEAGAPFQISRLRIYFDNQRPEITIFTRQKPPKVFAEIRYVGTGLLKGYWEVDGRRLANVFKHLTYGRQVIIELPQTSVLPTFNPGVHRIRFVITEPRFQMAIPQAIYYVRAKASEIATIKLLAPKDKKNLDAQDLVFRWEGLKRPVYAYLLEFRPALESEPLFSAYVKRTRYKIPSQIVAGYFSVADKFYWSVKAFGTNGEELGRSKVRSFRINSARFVPNQVILQWNSNKKNMIQELEKRLSIRLLYKYQLKSIGITCGVFDTKGQKVQDVIKKAKRIKGLKGASPNYIFKLMNDPLKIRQTISDIIDLDRLHIIGKEKETLVAVIDTGIDVNHVDIKDAIKTKRNFIEGKAYRGEIHGTGVAGIIAARVNGVGIEGIAPYSHLLALRACIQVKEGVPLGQCFSDTVARAIDFAINNRAEIVNMSFGAKVKDKIISALIEKGVKKGIKFVAPAGNDKDAEKMPFPAMLPGVISVCGQEKGSEKYFPNDKVCRGADIAAPYSDIFTTVPGNRFNFLDGTSMSAAIVSGLLANGIHLDSKSIKDRPGNICNLKDKRGNYLCKKNNF